MDGPRTNRRRCFEGLQGEESYGDTALPFMLAIEWQPCGCDLIAFIRNPSPTLSVPCPRSVLSPVGLDISDLSARKQLQIDECVSVTHIVFPFSAWERKVLPTRPPLIIMGI